MQNQPFTTDLQPPYYAVIFSSIRNDVDHSAYDEMNNHLMALAQKQPGFLGVDSVRDKLGITVSYWKSPSAIKAWQTQSDHLLAKRQARASWYKTYTIRIARVEQAHDFSAKQLP